MLACQATRKTRITHDEDVALTALYTPQLVLGDDCFSRPLVGLRGNQKSKILITVLAVPYKEDHECLVLLYFSRLFLE